MPKPLPALRMQSITNRLRRIDRASPANGDHRVDAGIGFDEGSGGVEIGDGRVFTDFGECAGVEGTEEGLEVRDEGGFGEEGGPGYYEGFAGGGGKDGDEVLFYRLGAIVEGLEMCRLPEAGERVGGGFGHFGGGDLASTGGEGRGGERMLYAYLVGLEGVGWVGVMMMLTGADVCFERDGGGGGPDAESG